MSEPIDLNHAFPDYVQQMQALRASDGHFKSLYEQYLTLEKELHKIEKQAETPEDSVVEDFKKKRLVLKDQMNAILHRTAA